jgi:DNA invertase Pin-like site-specific DNA recombinase
MNYYAYIRVSTAKQGEKGVSLEQQRSVIEQHARRHGFNIIGWYEERRTAAKRGRPIFGEMVQQLRRGRADGVIIHKVDRSARNLRDWSQLAELIDAGVSVQIAGETLDLTTRGGRLSADIQAVVAADYIRNLREEARKGINGRLKQGLYPFPALLGYADSGAGKPKRIDPASGPLVRQVFELYATSRYSLAGLVKEAWRLGLRNHLGKRVSKNSLSAMLNNPFYVGIIRIKRTGQTYRGAHKPLISASLFRRVEQILRGKTNTRAFRHDFLFRRMFSCVRCGYSLAGERQKGYIYYRCHTRTCPPTCVREEAIEDAVKACLRPLYIGPEEQRLVEAKIAEAAANSAEHKRHVVEALRLQLSQVDARLDRLTDAFVDGSLGKDQFNRRHEALLLERRTIEDQLGKSGESAQIGEQLTNFFELLNNAYLRYFEGLGYEKRESLEILTSNRLVDGKNVIIERKTPFERIANRDNGLHGGPQRDASRRWEKLLQVLEDSLSLIEIQ